MTPEPGPGKDSILWPRLTQGGTWLAWVLALGLLVGLIYAFTVPPWQHYDEPNHFEYAWLVASRGSIPQPGDFDPQMRRAVAESMIDHGFFTPLGFLPDLNAPNGEIWIGQYPQTGDPPLYYLWAALPLKLLQGSGDVTAQLYAARLASLVLYLLTLVAACGITGELAPPGHPLRFLLPLSLILMPAFVDLMTAVNNDVAAVAVFSWFLWGATRLIQRGLNWLDFFWSLAFALLGLFTRQTAYFAILLLPLAVVIAWYRRVRPIWKGVAWVAGGVLLLAAVLSVFSWGDAALWYRDASQLAPIRVSSPQAPMADYAFRLESASGEAPGRLVQILPVEQARQLAGKQVTLGAWMWASRPIEARSPELYVYAKGKGYRRPVSLTTQPQFFAFTTRLGRDTVRSWVILEPVPGKQDSPLEIYFDGLVLAEGAFPVDQAPIFESHSSTVGIWGGLQFTNLLRNASAEVSGPIVRNWADRLGERFLPGASFDSLSLTLYSLLDRPAAGWYYLNTFKNLGRTFWAVFGWNGVYLLGSNPYRPLAWITGIGLAGAVLAAWCLRKRLPWEVIFLFAVALLLVWGFAMLRGSNYIFLRTGFYPAARYVYPAVIPAMLAFVGGWVFLLDQTLGRWLRKVNPHRSSWLTYSPMILFLFGLNVYSLISMAQHWQAVGVL